MPYSIFFTQTGNAIHGTYEQRNLGHAVSHGCVRLSVKNAATLWELVKREKMANTKVVLSGAIPNAGPVARSRPIPLTPEESLAAAPVPLAALRHRLLACLQDVRSRVGHDVTCRTVRNLAAR